jgi:hypothetical protein
MNLDPCKEFTDPDPGGQKTLVTEPEIGGFPLKPRMFSSKMPFFSFKNKSHSCWLLLQNIFILNVLRRLRAKLIN